MTVMLVVRPVPPTASAHERSLGELRTDPLGHDVAPLSSVSGSITANSSPPMRAAMSIPRRCPRSRRRTPAAPCRRPVAAAVVDPLEVVEVGEEERERHAERLARASSPRASR